MPATAGVTAVNNAGQPPIHAPTLPRAGTVDAATVPFIRDSQRGQVADYLRQPAPKALALGPDSEAIGIGTGAHGGNRSRRRPRGMRRAWRPLCHLCRQRQDRAGEYPERTYMMRRLC